MLDLNAICTAISSGDNKLINTLIEDDRVLALINRAVNKILDKNKGYSRNELCIAAQTIVWEEVSKNYVTARDPKKGNNLVVKFLSTRIYNRLLNYIRDDKRLRHTDEGMIRIFNTVSINSCNEDGEPYTQLEGYDALDFIKDVEEKDFEEVVIKRLFYRLIKNKIVSVQDMYLFLLKNVNGLTNTKIQEILRMNFGQEVSSNWLVKRLRDTKEAITKSLNSTKG